MSDLVVPVLDVVNRPIAAVSSYVRDLTGLAGIQAENARLRAENETLRSWYQKALILQAENKSLQSLLNMPLPSGHDVVAARIIADPGSAYARSVLVKGGSAQGIQARYPVVSAEGLVGRVVETGQNTARVMLVTDMNARVPVWIAGRKIKAMMAGNNTDFPVLARVPADSELQDGDYVMTSGHGGLYPPGIAVGTVEKDPQSGAWRVRLSTALDRINHVNVMKIPTAKPEL